jgi:hypothetical protein
MESFGEWSGRLREFTQDHGWPASQRWVDWGDVIFWRGSLFVRAARDEERSRSAEQRFCLAARNDVAVVLEAICTVNTSTCCFVYLPESPDTADRLMIPRQGVKLSVATKSREAKLVTSRVYWWFLTVRGKDYLRWTHY